MAKIISLLVLLFWFTLWTFRQALFKDFCVFLFYFDGQSSWWMGWVHWMCVIPSEPNMDTTAVKIRQAFLSHNQIYTSNISTRNTEGPKVLLLLLGLCLFYAIWNVSHKIMVAVICRNCHNVCDILFLFVGQLVSTRVPHFV